ncbi:hypothetical protein C8R44DRAFT_739905 [Mycena epipterygia]|nr:hypothetical protein C8R44DRAFT_739905 [Mycena epipterygia]
MCTVPSVSYPKLPPSREPMQNLAQELVDEIIDNVGSPSYNKRDVATCGLVCRGWLPRSRFRLFSSITLSNSGSGGHNVDSFFHLLDTSSHPLLSFVEALELDFTAGPFDDAQMVRLHHCPRLTDLRVKVGTPERESKAVHRALQIHIPLLSINSVLLSRFDVETNVHIRLSALIDIVSAIPLLKFLRISCVAIVHNGRILPPCSLPHLKALEIYGDRNSANPFFTWILSAPILPIFKSLTLRTVIDGVNDPIEVYLQRAGPAIEFLALEVFETIGHDTFERRALGYCCELRHLKIEIAQLRADILTLLNAISSPRLATLEFIVMCGDRDEVAVPWNLIDQALAQPLFCALQNFSLVRRDAWFRSLAPEAKSQMPLANARGIFPDLA